MQTPKVRVKISYRGLIYRILGKLKKIWACVNPKHAWEMCQFVIDRLNKTLVVFLRYSKVIP
jgi:hypothetical protein